MYSVKRWLAILGAVVLVVCTSQLLWGVTVSDEDEYPWGVGPGGGGTGTSGVAGSGTVHTGSPALLRPIFIVRPAPMGGFYLIRIGLPSGVSAKTVVSGKKAGN